MLEYDPNVQSDVNTQSMLGVGRMTKRFDGLTIVAMTPDNQAEDIDRVEDANNSNLWGFLK
jgi:hypothetical protein